MPLSGKALIAHGGGPTAVLNSSLAGVIEEWRKVAGRSTLLGARFGVSGILNSDLLDLTAIPDATVRQLAEAPASALGSSRRALNEEDMGQIASNLKRHGIRYFLLTGGDGSMETALQVLRAASALDYELQVIGIPKTIDNDLTFTDHSPGYPSAARFFAHAARDAGADNRSLPSPICVLEVLGRNTGWLAAATALARAEPDDAPHLIYFPERPVSLDEMAGQVERVYRRLGRVFVVVCEGQRDPQGRPFGADVDRPDSAVHQLASNLGHTVALELSARLRIRARAERPGLVARSFAALTSPVDRAEAYVCGAAAVRAAERGESGVMITLVRQPEEHYQCLTSTADLQDVARVQRTFPDEWIAASGIDIRGSFLDWLGPLAGEIRHYPTLR